MSASKPPHLTILTGASRGLGLAMAQQLLAEGDQRLLTISRRPHAGLQGPALEQWAMDLADAMPVAQRLEAWMDALPPGSVASLTLIHNAALLSKMAALSEIDAAGLREALRVGLEAPLLLSSAFLRAGARLRLPMKLLGISSGLGRSAMQGSASYCAVKAGLDHLFRALALDEAAKPQGSKVCSLAPGVIDTDMQVQLRSSPPEQFTQAARFRALKEEGRLDSPAEAAAKVLAYLRRGDFGSKPVADVREP
jgi:NAD(P)-dependent dehydrogenase (short-subunit alcohol dehydrogenase family)